ncbi:MAG: ABC transporter permease [bacterium]
MFRQQRQQFLAKFNNVCQRLILLRQRYGYPLLALVRRDFTIHYAPTVLGLGWTVLQPLLQLSLYTVVFSVILQVKFRPHDGAGGSILYDLCGFLPYMALNEGIQRACHSLVENRNILRKTIFPAEVLPAMAVVSAAVKEGIGLVLLIGMAFGFGVRPSAWIAFLPLLMLLRLTITLGLAWLVSVLKVFISDMSQVLELILMAWMFLTPIFYPVDKVPEGLQWLLQINPLFHLAAAYRAVVLEGRSPLPMLPVLIVWAIIIPSLGQWFFRKAIERAKDFL